MPLVRFILPAFLRRTKNSIQDLSLSTPPMAYELRSDLGPLLRCVLELLHLVHFSHCDEIIPADVTFQHSLMMLECA